MPQRLSGEVLIFLLHTKNDLLSPCKYKRRKKEIKWSKQDYSRKMAMNGHRREKDNR
jgi:hypothetical protein